MGVINCHERTSLPLYIQNRSGPLVRFKPTFWVFCSDISYVHLGGRYMVKFVKFLFNVRPNSYRHLPCVLLGTPSHRAMCPPSEDKIL